ncbi:uncharacterized protein LOC129777045 [Toxorhynchites rutilus septentrionalis]|uniref:uncharacterized protein LOC129777045 n=1 Tax=Toxorhynchites rutilus septentrionalis TaxID=329112 RepID=UPI00247A25B9|nr:uncharacterized protein LOC129777045 [Toxorhynchites rutilus septentrionalis]
MTLCFGLASCFIISCALAAPTVHLIKPNDEDFSAGQADYQTDAPDIVDPTWMTVTMKPIVKTTVLDPVSQNYLPPMGSSGQHPSSQQPTIYPYHYPNAAPGVTTANHLYPYNIPHYQPNYPLQWTQQTSVPLSLHSAQFYPSIQQAGGIAQPCFGTHSVGGYQQQGY